MARTPQEQPYWEETFFTALAQTGFIKRSALAAGVTTGAIYGRSRKDRDFERRLQETVRAAQGGRQVAARGNTAANLPLQWRNAFLAALAETSNVTASAERAGVKPRAVYELRRENADFAARWRAALYEGYTNLEMEVLGYLRDPDPASKMPERKMDVANALRLLAAHKETVAREQAQRANVNAADVRASLARKVEALRQQVLEDRKKQKKPQP